MKDSTGKKQCNWDIDYGSNGVNAYVDLLSLKPLRRMLAMHGKLRSEIRVAVALDIHSEVEERAGVASWRESFPMSASSLLAFFTDDVAWLPSHYVSRLCSYHSSR